MLNTQNNWSNMNQNQQVYQGNQIYQPQQPNNYGSNSIPRSVIFGSFINSPQDIRPQDIPFDKNPAFFPLNNGSTIIVKYWDGNSNLQTDVYKLVPKDEITNDEIIQPVQRVDDQNDELYTKIMDTLETLNNRISALEDNILPVPKKQSKDQKYNVNYKEGSK